jgi:hypothetical protein
MTTALERAALQLRDDLARYDIKVNGYVIHWRNETQALKYGTPKQKCLPILRDYIRRAAEIAEWRNKSDKQVPML